MKKETEKEEIIIFIGNRFKGKESKYLFKNEKDG
jgi:hypothetical protein